VSDPESPQTTDDAPAPTPARSVPVAAIAGAVILVGLVAFALYRRNVTTGGRAAGDGSAPAAGGTAPDGAAATGTVIAAQPPVRLSPEAAILAERYRCVCGCNDTLTVCTCKLPRGSDEMKKVVQEMATAGTSPERADQAMAEKYGPGVLLKNPAPPQTRPSHASEAAAAAH